MDEIQAKLNEALPRVETFVDCAGRERKFELYLRRSLVPGYLLAAREISESDQAYEFEVFSEASPFDGLGRLRAKMRRGLSRRYLIDSVDGLVMTHDEIAGRISHRGLVIDGRLVSWEALEKILTTHEGFEIDIRIRGGDE